MAIYVDNMRAKFGRMIMCHMIADTHSELESMARTIRIQPKWLQDPGEYSEHYDICLSKRAQAIRAGALELTWRDLTVKLRQRHTPIGMATYYALRG